jgi:predicted heme/steroid binding protein
MKKLLILLGVALLIAALFVGCSSDDAEEPQQEETQTTDEDATMEEDMDAEEDAGAEEEMTFTLAELAEFDGKGGNPAYVAVDGVVYDVTGSANWPEGDHTPCDLDAMAGKDLSDVLEQSPARMRTLIENQPVVGMLEE